MAKVKANTTKIFREVDTLQDVLSGLPDNPVAWGYVLSVVAPILARLAVRMALRKLSRGMSEEKVNAIGKTIGGIVKSAAGTAAVPFEEAVKRKG